ncbi:MAG TPA: acyl-CoA dehydrogenase family protein [Candidatus Dormibacteraeota bacterium]|nr:acyl-CoA dehydrogenase family protein [Candidatus Dormibacteraeota bacterium]
MISFAMTDEQEAARTTMRGFAESALRPHARECDEASAIPDAFYAQAWELGLTATQLPESVGGYGAPRSPITNAIVLEELAYGDATLAIAAAAPSLFAYAIADQGSDAQRQRYLPAFCGERYETAAVAVSEPHPASTAWAPRTRAERNGNGWVLSGRKCFVPLADRASHFLVVARAGDALDAFIVPRDASGLTISDVEKNLGLKALPTTTLELDGIHVPAADRLGEQAGCDVPRLLNQSRVALAAILNGLSRAVLDYCVPYAKERVAFGEPIARKQSIAFRLAEMQMEVESMRWMIWKAASQLERGLDATRSAHLARAYAAEKAIWVSDNGIQVLGGHGFIREHPVEMWYRNARTLGVLEGLASV